MWVHGSIHQKQNKTQHEETEMDMRLATDSISETGNDIKNAEGYEDKHGNSL